MTSYEGLLLDFGGVVTTDFFASLGAHCERLGLPHDSFRNLVTVDPVGRELYHQCDSLHPIQLKRRCSQGRWGGPRRR